MTTFKESGLEFTFPKNWVVKKYDEHRFYHYLSGLGFKGVDLIALTPEKKLILIEIKNYVNRFPQDGIDPTETLVNNVVTFSEKYIQKFEDTFQLLRIVQKFFNRKKWYQWIAKPLRPFLPYSFLINLDWGFWTIANEFLNKKNVQLILWLEVAPNLESQKIQKIHIEILDTFHKSLPQYSFHIFNHNNRSTNIQTKKLNH